MAVFATSYQISNFIPNRYRHKFLQTTLGALNKGKLVGKVTSSSETLVLLMESNWLRACKYHAN